MHENITSHTTLHSGWSASPCCRVALRLDRVVVRAEAVFSETDDSAPSRTATTSMQDPVRLTSAFLTDIDKRRDVSAYESRVRSAANLCRLSPREVAIEVNAGKITAEGRGLTLTNFEILDALVNAIPPSEAGNIPCREAVVLHIQLRLQGR